MDSPLLFRGQKHIDRRGALTFNNSLDLSSFCRAYEIGNSAEQPKRGWHGHQFESKLFIAIEGLLKVCAVKVTDWNNPDPAEKPVCAELKAGTMDAFFVPGGFANAILSLQPKSRVLVFSSFSLEESLEDDYRFDVEFWGM